jgi:FtsH-binding integral membrane protein
MTPLERVGCLAGAGVAAILSYWCFVTANDPGRNAFTRILGRYFNWWASMPMVFFSSVENQARSHGVGLVFAALALLCKCFLST